MAATWAFDSARILPVGSHSKVLLEIATMSNDSQVRETTEQIQALLREREQLAKYLRLALMSSKVEALYAEALEHDDLARIATLLEVRFYKTLVRADRPEQIAGRVQRQRLTLPPNFGVGAGLEQRRTLRGYYYGSNISLPAKRCSDFDFIRLLFLKVSGDAGRRGVGRTETSSSRFQQLRAR
jgi:hypothetical protein